jgi:hypothetical protein
MSLGVSPVPTPVVALKYITMHEVIGVMENISFYCIFGYVLMSTFNFYKEVLVKSYYILSVV